MESRKLSIIGTIVLFLLHLAAWASLANETDNRKFGFSLELVHCDSVDSPLYAGNLTSAERIQRDVRLSESRRIWLESYATATGPQDLNIRPVLTNVASMYTVKVGIGTDPVIESHLVVDTGSSLVWVQSEPCNTCIEHDGPGYSPAKSHSYRRFPGTDPICSPPSFQRGPTGQCTYDYKYGISDASYRHTRGALAFEKFSFESATVVDNVIFGASNNNSRDIFGNRRNLLGIFGMGMQAYSFPIQMARRDSRIGRFSYCLVPEDGASSRLRFGDDVGVISGDYKTTPFVGAFLPGSYSLVLLDVSVDGKPLGLPVGTFLPNRARGSVGVVFDSGTPMTFLIQPAYDAVVGALATFFRKLNLERVAAAWDRSGRLCYRKPSDNFDTFPDMDFHFTRGATLRPDRNQLFVIYRQERVFCLDMAPARTITIIGARAQRNVNFVYDYDVTGMKQLHFAAKDCREA